MMLFNSYELEKIQELRREEQNRTFYEPIQTKKKSIAKRFVSLFKRKRPSVSEQQECGCLTCCD
ncbi:hypothetical protein JOC48_003748 [Aquibacillus albus]|uniref:Uncharacterized protein n=1 Tax=Aquibacillus albus TaxID=1168171 RepID=A0ABS2N502_9BACI|nr:hypothetical protein [Aquibacillus albus]